MLATQNVIVAAGRKEAVVVDICGLTALLYLY